MDRVGTRIGLATIFSAWTVICALHAFAGPGTAIESIFDGALLGSIPGPAGDRRRRPRRLHRPALRDGAGRVRQLHRRHQGAGRAVSRPRRASRAGGFFNAGRAVRLGHRAAADPRRSSIDTFHVSWQWGFVIPALLGLLWLIPWLLDLPDEGADDGDRAQAGRAAAAPVADAIDRPAAS